MVFGLIHNPNVLSGSYFWTYSSLWVLLMVTKHRRAFKFTKTNVIMFILAYIMADVISAIVHIYLDHSTITNDGSVLDAQRRGFRYHHPLDHVAKKLLDPTFEPYYEMNYVYPYALFIIIIANFVNLTLRNFMVYLATMICLFQATHLYAHASILLEDPNYIDKAHVPWCISLLQKYHIILPPNHHKLHHEHKKHGINFAIFHGLTDPLINFIYTSFLKGY